MNKALLSEATEAKQAIIALFENKPPVLVEVRFASAGAAPDWYLCEEEEQFEQILERVGQGTELHISSVWDLKNQDREICLRK